MCSYVAVLVFLCVKHHQFQIVPNFKAEFKTQNKCEEKRNKKFTASSIQHEPNGQYCSKHSYRQICRMTNVKFDINKQSVS